jgi:hypothetical protein
VHPNLNFILELCGLSKILQYQFINHFAFRKTLVWEMFIRFTLKKPKPKVPKINKYQALKIPKFEHTKFFKILTFLKTDFYKAKIYTFAFITVRLCVAALTSAFTTNHFQNQVCWAHKQF